MRRALWKAIEQQRSANQCILFTTHAMEEAEAACTRLGIMVKGKFEALGSIQHLKNKFGGGYIVNVTLDTEDHQCVANVDDFFAQQYKHWCVFLMSFFILSYVSALIQWLTDLRLPPHTHNKTSVLREAYGKYRSYDLGTVKSLAHLFGIIEQNKKKLQVIDYSVAQSSLEQVFLHFAKQQELPSCV